YTFYVGAPKDPIPQRFPTLARAVRNGIYFDDLYTSLITITHEFLASVANWFDQWFISGLAVRGIHGTTELWSLALRQVQTGHLQTCAFVVAIGVAVVLYTVLRH